MIPKLHRVKRLRRKIGADLRPFTPIARRRRNAHRYREIASKIRRLEAALVGHLRVDVVNVLD